MLQKLGKLSRATYSLYQSCRVLYRKKKKKIGALPLDIITIYCGLMRSVIEYAAVVYAGLQQYLTAALENVQNRAFSMMWHLLGQALFLVLPRDVTYCALASLTTLYQIIPFTP